MLYMFKKVENMSILKKEKENLDTKETPRDKNPISETKHIRQCKKQYKHI